MASRFGFRKPAYVSDLRANTDEEARVYVRAARKGRTVVTDHDDVPRGETRSWKSHRNTQYK